MIAEEREPIDQLWDAVENIHTLHEHVCETEHALFEGGKPYIPYEPTFFLYNFFCFNIIFNIDWKASADSGEVIEHERGQEKEQIKSLIDFCFPEDTGFVDAFLPTYRRIVTHRYDARTILKETQSIVPDGKRINESLKGNFIAACTRVLLDKHVSVKDVKSIYTFIYDVRCNIVHGTKTMQHMTKTGQRKRITTYSYFIVALIHMLFMRLQREINGYYDESMSESFLEQLSRRDMIKTNIKQVYHELKLKDGTKNIDDFYDV